MTEKNHIQSVMPASLPAEPDARTVYSYGGLAGDDLHISGLVSFASDGTIVGEGGIDAQVEQVFTRMRAVVEEAGGSMDDIVSTTTYLTDVTQAPSISAARAPGLSPRSSVLRR